MKSLFFFLSGAILMGVPCLILANQNEILYNQNESYKTLNSLTAMPVNGDNGRFLPEQNLFYVKTVKNNENNCLSALHELAHSIQWKNQDKCFYNYNDLYSCEEFAENFVKENDWRCEDL